MKEYFSIVTGNSFIFEIMYVPVSIFHTRTVPSDEHVKNEPKGIFPGISGNAWGNYESLDHYR